MQDMQLGLPYSETHVFTPTLQGPDGKWNKFGGRLAWDASAICSNNPAYGGRGARKQGDDYAAAPNVDHTQVGMTRFPQSSMLR
jgi:hypothetical protein